MWALFEVPYEKQKQKERIKKINSSRRLCVWRRVHNWLTMVLSSYYIDLIKQKAWPFNQYASKQAIRFST